MPCQCPFTYCVVDQTQPNCYLGFQLALSHLHLKIPLPIFFSPRLSFSRTWEPPLWSVIIKEDRASISQSLCEGRILISLVPIGKRKWSNHREKQNRRNSMCWTRPTDRPLPTSSTTFPIARAMLKTLPMLYFSGGELRPSFWFLSLLALNTIL